VIPSVTLDPATPLGTPRWLWLRYVNGFHDGAHCAKCLLGTPSRRITPRMTPGKEILLIEQDTPYLYLCAGFGKYEWNLHVAMVTSNQAFSVTAHNGATFHFRGLRRLWIPPLELGFRRYPDAMTTCRNFQFGYSAFLSGRPVVSFEDGLAAANALPPGPGQVELTLK